MKHRIKIKTFLDFILVGSTTEKKLLKTIAGYLYNSTVLCLFLSSALHAAETTNAGSPTPTSTSAQVERNENWFQAQIRKFRTYPHLDRAYRLINTNRLAEAKKELQQYLAIDPKDFQARMTYVSVLHRLKEYQEVIQQTNIVLQDQPNAPSALLYRGLSREALGQHETALADFQNVAANTKAQPEDRNFASNTAADLALYQNRSGEALTALDHITKDKQNFNFYFRQGMALESLGKLTEAEAAYHAALEVTTIPGERLKALIARGNIQKNLSQWDAARKSYTEAQELDPNNPQVMKSLAAVIYKVKDYKQAANWLQKGLELNPNPKDREFLADIQVSRKNYRDAISEYTKLLAETTSNDKRYRIYMALGYSHSSLGQHAQAAESFRKAANLRQDNTTLMALALAQEQSGLIKEAIQTLLTLLERYPLVDTHIKLANLYTKLGDITNTLDHLEHAVHDNDSAELHFRLGMLYLKQNNSTNALNHLNQATRSEFKKQLQPEQLRAAYYQQGYLYYQSNQYQAAVDAFRLAIKSGQDDSHIHQNLGLSLYAMRRWEDALEEFLVSLKQEKTPVIMIQIAHCYQQLKNNNLAIQYLSMAQSASDPNDKKLQKQLYAELGYLYSEESDYSHAAEVWKKSLQIENDPIIALRLGGIQRKQGQLNESEKTLRGIALNTLPAELRPTRSDELAEVYYAQHDPLKAIEALKEANSLEPTAERFYRLGIYHLKLGHKDLAITHFEAALTREPKNAAYAESLAYAYKDTKRLNEATDLLESILKEHPEKKELHKELAYAHMQNNNNPKAEQSFKRAIDARSETVASTAQEQEARDQDIYLMRNEVTKLSRTYGISLYNSYRTAKDAASNSSTSLSGSGVISSQGGAEFFYQPPNIGLRDEKIFQVFARTLWGNQPQSLSIDKDSLQGGVGVRYKPLKDYNLFVGAERLIKIGTNAQNNWLLRAAHAWNNGVELKLHKPWWYTTQLYNDVGYYVQKGGTWAYYAEARHGVTVNFSDRFLMTPHVVLDGRYQTPNSPDALSYLEGGAGVSLKYLFNDSHYENYRSAAEFLIQYKRKLSPSSSGSWVFTADMQY